MMKIVTMKKIAAALAMTAGLSSVAIAAGFDVSRLGVDLTPLGAEKAGNADGSIPEWTGAGVTIPAGYIVGRHHPDPFADEQPIFTITADNAEAYKDKLSDGQLALLKKYPDTFKMNIYQTHRTAKYPQWYYDNTRECAETATTTDGGDAIDNVHACLPFPLAKTGHEAMWNHMLRFQGLYIELHADRAAPDANGRYVLGEFKRHSYFPYYDPALKGTNERLIYILPRTLAPARSAGDSFLIHDYLNPKLKPRQAWRYFGGQRRVRRAPVFVFDTPIPSSGGIRTLDSFDLFFGSLEKYDWKLVGKKEHYIPYNSYKLGSGGIKNEELLKPGHINSDYTRYELHRVWVVEATLKEGERHIYPRRTVYLDEDTWQAVLHDSYDDKGLLWRTQEKHSKLYYEVPLVGNVMTVTYDLLSKRYAAIPLMGEYKYTFNLTKELPEISFFTPASLRKLGVR